jgi:hypothetical protein
MRIEWLGVAVFAEHLTQTRRERGLVLLSETTQVLRKIDNFAVPDPTILFKVYKEIIFSLPDRWQSDYLLERQKAIGRRDRAL